MKSYRFDRSDFTFAATLRQGEIGRLAFGSNGPLRSSDRTAPLAPECALHAEALGCDAQRRWRRLLARACPACTLLPRGWPSAAPPALEGEALVSVAGQTAFGPKSERRVGGPA